VGAPVIAVMAGLGSMLVMYGGASHMIKRGGGYKWLEKIKALTTENPDTPAWQRRAKKILMYAAFPVLTILSTASAAWSFCAPILKSTSNLTINVVLKIIGLIAWPFMIFLTLLFDTDNALESIQQVANDAGRIYRNISNAWQQETRLQFFNPFRQARLAFMACHAYCFGISTDNLPGNFIPPAVAAGPGAIMELATEWHYIFENAEPDEHNSNHAVLLEGDHLSTEDDEELPPLVHVPGSSNSSSTSCCDHDHDEADNDHDHGSILDYALRPFDYAAARWHWLFADRNYIWGNKTYSWEQAKRKFLPEKSMPDRPPLSKELSAYLMQQELAALEEEYTEKKTDGYFGTAIANKKASTFATLKKLIIFSSSTPEEKSVPENNSQNLSLALKTHESTLKENRYPLFSRTNPQAILSTQEIAADPFINEVCFNTAPACA
jgi:hypothetical protein